MLWVITERQILYQLVKRRRVRSPNKKVVRNPDGTVEYHGSNYQDYLRRTYGIMKDEFVSQLYWEEFDGRWYVRWAKELMRMFRIVYFEHFTVDVEAVIADMIRNSILIESSRPEGVFIKEDFQKARRMLSAWYFPRLLIEYEPVRDLVKEAIKWSVIAFLAYVGITQTITAALNNN